MLEVCLKIIKRLKKIKINIIFLLYEKKIEHKGKVISEEIEARDEYLFTIPIVSQDTMNIMPSK